MAAPSDPLHQRSPTGIRWTTNNFAEALPGVATPLTWGVWSYAMTDAAFDVFYRFGAFSRRDIRRFRRDHYPVVGVFFGHIAGNIDLMSRAVARLPGFDPGAFEQQLFGLDPAATPVRRTRRRWPIIALKAPLAVATIRRRVQRERAATEAWWRERIAHPIPAAQARADLRDARDRFARMLAAHSMQSQLAQGAFDAIARLATSVGRGGLERRLVSGYGDLEETVLARDLWSASRGRLDVAVFLSRHGFHGPNEGELSSRVWREDDRPVVAAIDAYRTEPDSRAPDALAARQEADRHRAEAELLGALGWTRRPGARLLLRVASRWVPRREVGKSGFLRAVDVGRAAARSIGLDLIDRGAIDDPDDVFFLTYEEAVGPAPVDARELVTARRAAHERHRAVELPTVWEGDPEPVNQELGTAEPQGVVTGVPVSPGRVVGRARVVRDATECATPLTADEILVTRTTDPSWVSMFLTAGGLAIDIGGPMSHGAIVARELGVPCVINTGDGTSRIPDGARIELDGDAGSVRILDGTPESP